MSLLNRLLEDIGTGTGASFTAGAGEQFATPFVFKGKKKKTISEVSVSYTPEKRKELYEKYLKEFPQYKSKVERYVNVFEAYDLKSILDGIDKAEKFSKVGEALQEEISKIDSVLDDLQYEADEEGDKEMSDKFRELELSYYKISKVVDKVYQAMEDVVAVMEKVKEKLKEN